MREESASLLDALCLPSRGALVSIVGGGGKSALLFALGEKLQDRVVLSTTTRIFEAQRSRARESVSIDSARFEDVWPKSETGLLVIGRVEGDKAHGVPPDEPARWLARNDVDHVVVEADGSRMRPAKAPAEHEPVIATGSTHVAIVAGVDALDSSIDESCHRPERVAALVGGAPGDRLTPETLAALLAHAEGGCKDVPADAHTIVVINKVESEAQQSLARRVAVRALEEDRVDRVIAGALEGADPDHWLVFRRD